MSGGRVQMPSRIGSTFDPPRGRATLNGLSNVAISCPSVTANSIITHSVMIPAGTLGLVAVTSITPGVGFTVASVALATSVIGWCCMEP